MEGAHAGYLYNFVVVTMVLMIEGQEAKWPGKVQEKASEVQLLFSLTTGVLFTRNNVSIHSFRGKTNFVRKSSTIFIRRARNWMILNSHNLHVMLRGIF